MTFARIFLPSYPAIYDESSPIRYLTRPQLLTRLYPLPKIRDIPSWPMDMRKIDAPSGPPHSLVR
jgi:hypothetical protein